MNTSRLLINKFIKPGSIVRLPQIYHCPVPFNHGVCFVVVNEMGQRFEHLTRGSLVVAVVMTTVAMLRQLERSVRLYDVIINCYRKN